MVNVSIEQAPPDPVFEQAYSEHFDTVARFADSKVMDGTGPDIAQEVMLRLWRRGVDMVDDQGNHTRRWLIQVARNAAIDVYRARQCRPLEYFPGDEFEENARFSMPGDTMGAVHAAMLTEQALGCMSNEQRKAVELCYLEELTYEEAAARIGVPAGTVKSRCHYGIKAARTAMMVGGISAATLLD